MHPECTGIASQKLAGHWNYNKEAQKLHIFVSRASFLVMLLSCSFTLVTCPLLSAVFGWFITYSLKCLMHNHK